MGSWSSSASRHVKEPGIFTAVAWVLPLAQELSHVIGPPPTKKKKIPKKPKTGILETKAESDHGTEQETKRTINLRAVKDPAMLG